MMPRAVKALPGPANYASRGFSVGAGAVPVLVFCVSCVRAGFCCPWLFSFFVDLFFVNVKKCYDIDVKIIAGTEDETSGDSNFKSPFGIDWTRTGELLVADTENSAVKLVTAPTGGAVKNVVGSGNAIKTPVGLCE